jgi:thiol:disulfide interchange protein
MATLKILLSLFFVFLFEASLQTSPTFASAPHPVLAEIVSEMETLSLSKESKEEKWVALHLRLERNWHVYWKNPGDSGAPPEIEWTLPKGVSIGEFHWPVPNRIPFPPLMNYGYEDEVLLMAPLFIKDDFQGKEIEIRGEAKWLVCKEICIPGRASLELTLPITAEKASTPSRSKSDFEKTRANLPTHSSQLAWKFEAVEGNEHYYLKIEIPESDQNTRLRKASFFSEEKNQIKNAPHQNLNRQTSSTYELRIEKASSQEPSRNLSGVLKLETSTSIIGGTEILGVQINEPISSWRATASTPQASLSFQILLFAFIGGLILNLMPCVFPVLSLKFLGFIKHSSQGAAGLRAHGWYFFLGVLSSFWVLTAALLLLRASGYAMGWGFQLQSPIFIFLLSTLFFVLGLNLLGIFEFRVPFGARLSGLVRHEGWLGSFSSGILTTLVATPCTAPFMGAAIGFSLTQSPLIAFLIFTLLASGLSAPYLLLSHFPQWVKFLPPPGRWMETFKQAMAFPLFATVIWLSWVLGIQAGVSSLALLLSFLLFVRFLFWINQRWPSSLTKVLTSGTAALSLGIALTSFLSHNPLQAMREIQLTERAVSTPLTATRSAPLAAAWVPFSETALEEYRDSGIPVFIDFTAAWCVICQVNKRAVLDTRMIMDAFEKAGVVLMRADWTSYDPHITEFLSKQGRSGVPFYILYGKERESAPLIFPELLTRNMITEALNSFTQSSRSLSF